MKILLVTAVALQVGGLTYFSYQTKEIKHENRYKRVPVIEFNYESVEVE